MSINSKSVQSVLDEINDLRNANLSNLDVNDLETRFGQFLTGYWHRTVGIKVNPIFRARRYKSELYQHDELWYPASEFVTKYGRLNDIGQPIFYAATTEYAAICEMEPNVGDMIFIVKCELIDPDMETHVEEIGLSERAKLRHNVVQIDPFENTDEARKCLLSQDDLAKNSAIRAFVVEQLTKVVDEGNEDEYKITLAIANLLMSHDNIDGMAYPGIASNNSSEFSDQTNLALKPESVDRLYQATEYKLIEILDKKGDFGFTVIDKINAERLPDGGLQWM